jgi:hypothetical protein
MRSVLAGCLALALAAPVAAQNADPDVKAGSGTAFPQGWTARFDKAGASASDVTFVPMGEGLHITAGPSGIYYDAANRAEGNFEVTASFTLMKPAAHPEAYGLFYGGNNLEAENQDYLYFIVRQDGKFMIRHRAGSEVHTLMPWTESAAVKSPDASGKATNTLTARATADALTFLVNGTEVHTLPRAMAAGKMNIDGIVGLRVNHNLDVHVGKLEVKKL